MAVGHPLLGALSKSHASGQGLAHENEALKLIEVAAPFKLNMLNDSPK